MNNVSRRLVLLLLSAVITSLVAGCATVNPPPQKLLTSDQPTPEMRQPLRVGLSPNAPPMAFTPNGKLQGLEVEFAHRLGRHLNREVQFVKTSWPNLIPALEKGRIDIIMSGMTITKARSYRVAFTSPYMRTGQLMLVRLDEANRFATGLQSLLGSGVRIGVITNTTGDYFITKTVNRPRLTRFANSKQAVKALRDQSIDVFVHDGPIISHFAARNEANRLTLIPRPMTEEYLAWAVNRDDRQLLQQANSFLEQSRHQQWFRETLQRWLPFM